MPSELLFVDDDPPDESDRLLKLLLQEVQSRARKAATEKMVFFKIIREGILAEIATCLCVDCIEGSNQV